MTRNLFSTEAQEQKALIQWANLTPVPDNRYKFKIGDFLLHIPNERKCSAVAGFQLKLMGVKKGVSDLLFAYPLNKKRGLWLEMKSKSGKVSTEQKEFLDLMESVGYDVSIARSFEEAKGIILKYLGE